MPTSGNQADGSNQENPSAIALLTELVAELILEVRAMRLAIVSIACESGKADPKDFDPQYINDDSSNQQQ